MSKEEISKKFIDFDDEDMDIHTSISMIHREKAYFGNLSPNKQKKLSELVDRAKIKGWNFEQIEREMEEDQKKNEEDLKEIKEDNEYCHYSTGQVMRCGICKKPIRLDETMIEVEIHKRINMGCMDFYGSRLYHEHCVPDIMKLKGSSSEV